MSWKSIIAVVGIAATIGCKKEDPPPAPERVSALRDMNPDQIEASSR